jgi:hypothetical protein
MEPAPVTTNPTAGGSGSRPFLRLPPLLAEAMELSRLPAVTIEMRGGDQRCRQLYDYFTRRHPKYRLIQNKRWGVALLPLPDTFANYMGGGKRQRLRQHLSRAVKAGYTFAPLDPFGRLDEVMGINRSADERQGQAMHPDYFDEAAVRRYFEQGSEVYGVSDSAGVLRAYADIRVCGDVAILLRLLGHAEALDQGVMYLLLTELIHTMIDRRRSDGTPAWFMYDMFSGASAGLRQFKRTIGCEPYRVKWVWRS